MAKLGPCAYTYLDLYLERDGVHNLLPVNTTKHQQENAHEHECREVHRNTKAKLSKPGLGRRPNLPNRGDECHGKINQDEA